MKIEDMIKNAMAKMLERRIDFSGIKVFAWEEQFEKAYYTGCDTCGYGGDEDKYIVEIWYTHDGWDGNSCYRYEGSFAELIRELDTE